MSFINASLKTKNLLRLIEQENCCEIIIRIEVKPNGTAGFICEMVSLVLIVVCVFGVFGERAADGFVFACADIRLHATAGIGSLDLREPFRLVAQRRVLRILESWQRRGTGAHDALRAVPVQGGHQNPRVSYRGVSLGI